MVFDEDKLIASMDAALDGKNIPGGQETEFDRFRTACAESMSPGSPAGHDGRRDLEESLRARRVANRVLGTMEREGAGQRGDLHLMAQFVRDRLRDSRLLRFVAALLLVQLVVTPVVVAFQVARQGERAPLELRFLPPLEPLDWGPPVLDPGDYDLESYDDEDEDETGVEGPPGEIPGSESGNVTNGKKAR